MSDDNFYASAYWRSGDGLNLWNMRKMFTLLSLVSQETGKLPFLTTGEDPSDNFLIAEWSTQDSNHYLIVEFSGLNLSVYAYSMNGANYVETFSYEFTHGAGPHKESDGIVPWEKLPDAIEDAKKWLKTHSNEIPDRLDLQQLFNY